LLRSVNLMPKLLSSGKLGNDSSRDELHHMLVVGDGVVWCSFVSSGCMAFGLNFSYKLDQFTSY
jgi:hypothetical protein